MVAAPEPPSVLQHRSAVRRRLPALLAGVSFGLGYGVVQRLMAVEFPRLVELGQPFDVREFPGTSLEALRLKTGATAQSIRGDLGVLELEEQEKTSPLAPSAEPEPSPQPPPPQQLPLAQPLDAEPVPEPVPLPPARQEALPDLPDPATP